MTGLSQAPERSLTPRWSIVVLLSAALFAEPNPCVIKGVLYAQGKIPSPAVRLPLLPARDDTVRAAMNLLAAPPGVPR